MISSTGATYIAAKSERMIAFSQYCELFIKNANKNRTLDEIIQELLNCSLAKEIIDNVAFDSYKPGVIYELRRTISYRLGQWVLYGVEKVDKK